MKIECARDGEMVWTVFVSSTDATNPRTWIEQAEVISAEHGIVRRNGVVRTMHDCEGVVATEQEAHEAAARMLSAWAVNMMAQAATHAQKASALGVGEAVPV